jgi:hypothetical protein
VMPFTSMHILEEHHCIFDQIDQTKRIAQPFRIIF